MSAEMTTGRGNGGNNTLQAFLQKPETMRRLQAVASETMKPEDLVRLALMTVMRNPYLAKCSQASILAALMDAAALGIAPGGMMGRGYLVPRKNNNTKQLECCFDPGWRGLIDIARRSGQVRNIHAHAVHEKDEFSVTYGIDETIHHKPFMSGDPGRVVAAYAVAHFADGSTQVEVLTKGDIDKIRNTSTSANGPWKDWEDQMARKSAVRRLCKYLPFDPGLDKALRVADRADGFDEGVAPTAIDAPKGRALAAKIRKSQESSPQPLDDLAFLPVGDDEDGELAADAEAADVADAEAEMMEAANG